MSTKTDRPRHIYEIFIRARPEKIWEALTTPEFTRQYFHATDISSDWKVGSPVVFQLADGTPAVEGRVLAVEPQRTLSYSWHVLYDSEMSKERPSRVTFRIEPVDDVCKLTVIHDDFEPDSIVYPEISKGWSAILGSLKSLLETGKALPIAGNQNGGPS